MKRIAILFAALSASLSMAALAADNPDSEATDGRKQTPKEEQAQKNGRATAEQATVLPEMTATASPFDETSYSVPNASTATKTDTPIMETPVSIQVVPRAVMDDQQAVRLEDVLKNVSSFQPGNNSGGVYDTFFIRGFEIGNDINTTTYRDGIRLRGYPSVTAGLERVEVLKGPASVLYGRLEPGGLVNVVTKKPLNDAYYSLQQQFGSYELYRTSVDATGPIPLDASGNLLYRFNLDYLSRNSFRDFVSEEQIYLAPKLTWNIDDRNRLDIGFEYRHQDLPAAFDGRIPASGNRPVNVPISRQLNDPDLDNFQRTNYVANVDFSHRFNADWKVNLRGMYARQEWEYADFIPFSFDEKTGELSRGFVQHINPGIYDWWYTALETTGHLSLLGTWHTLLLGADYYLETRDEVFAVDLSTIPNINVFNPVYGGFTPTFDPANNFDFSSLDEWYGVYLQDQIAITDQWHLLAGGRFDTTRFVEGNEEIKKDVWKPRVGLVYQPWKWLSLYGHYAESLGSPNSGRSRDGKPFDPQEAEEFEVGAKTELFDGRLISSLAYYELTKTNLPTPDPSNPFFSVVLGEARSRGIELDLSGQVTDRLNVIGSYAYTDTEITKDNAGNEGHRLPNAPLHSGSLWAKFAVTERFTVGAGIFAAGEREVDNENSAQMPGFVRLDAMAGYQWKLGDSRQPFQGDARLLFRLARSLAIETCGMFGSLWRLGGGFLGPRGCFRIAHIFTCPARKISNSTI